MIDILLIRLFPVNLLDTLLCCSILFKALIHTYILVFGFNELINHVKKKIKVHIYKWGL